MTELSTGDKRHYRRIGIAEPLLAPAMRRSTQIVVLAILITLLGTLVLQIKQLHDWQIDAFGRALERVQQDMQATAEAIDTKLRSAILVATKVADDLGEGELQFSQTRSRQRS